MQKYFALTAVLLITACGLSEKACVEGDWRGIGARDGAAGRSPEFVANHTESCANHGISPDLKAWEEGRQIGLKTYCTPSSAYEVGANGQTLRDVCPDADMAAMQKAHKKGLWYHRVTGDINSLERERRAVLNELASLPHDGTAAARHASLRSRLLSIDSRLRFLYLDRRRYSEF
ncbi:hypothetical protein GCM10008927_07310 [Amylibacter ulvae]|uniref:DUF2799 domain-containing protein n=1 Tax=Paramylibacter ulvae TaxID=1651968 RepID=A0ABQ3CVK4_9RHOB|nr:DUF2799 domain-containing protein [Amylibacter ulvae]GHA44927.1 hypothetical protein GCM10008927_07310 [Amylibacter ulvae]